MDYKTQTGTDIETAFQEFHAKNPRVYEHYKEQVYRAVRRKREKVSSKTILGWIRWEVSIDVKTDEVYKINDAFTSRYARLFVKEHPQYEHLFNFRELRDGSEEHKPNSEDLRIIEILQAMNKNGAYIVFHEDIQSASLILKLKKYEPITNVQLNKMKANKWVEHYKKTMFSNYYCLSKKGKKYLGGRTP